MTEDAGPPGPPERFSSLPIREADATAAAGTDGSELIIRCDMSQAFGTGVGSAQRSRSRETGQPPMDALPPEPPWLPRQDFQIASQPARPRPDRQLGIWVSLRPRASAPNVTGGARRWGRFLSRRSRQG